MYESASPSFQPIEIKFGDDITVPDTNNEVSYDNVDIPTNISQVSRIIKPEGYNTDFSKDFRKRPMFLDILFNKYFFEFIHVLFLQILGNYVLIKHLLLKFMVNYFLHLLVKY